MGNRKPSALLSLIGVMLIWPYVLTESVSPTLQNVDGTSLSAEQREERPHVVKRSTDRCGNGYENYCLNKGQCMYFVDFNDHHCKCQGGYYGPRCEIPELVFKPMANEKIIFTVFCVCLLIIGLAGVLYFCCKRCKKNRFPGQQKRHGYKGVQTA